MLTEEYIFVLRNFQILHKRPNLFQLFTYGGRMSTSFEPNQMTLAILIDQLQ